MSFPRVHHEATEKAAAGTSRKQVWFVLLASFPLWFLLIYFNSSSLLGGNYELVSVVNNYAIAMDSDESNSLHVTGTYNETAGVLHFKRETVGVVKGDFPVAVQQINVTESGKVPISGTKCGETSVNRLILENGKVQHADQKPVSENKAEQGNQTLLAENEAQSVNNSISKNEAKSVDGVAVTRNGIERVNPLPTLENRTGTIARQPARENGVGMESHIDSCSGRYIYIHDLPSRFNDDILRDCRSLNKWSDMCRFLLNTGLGPRIPNSERVFSNTGWFATDQFSLEVIFHNRMKQYKCLTNDSSQASAIFVPFYAGLDVGRYLWGFNASMRDSTSLELVKWLTSRPEWKSMGGRDHFLVAGRISWDFRRMSNRDSDWGNNLLFFPESKNMTTLVIESSPWSSNDFAIPYPTYFHPSSDIEVFQWQNRMRRQKRRFLLSFAGAPRPNLEDSIRGEIIEQCQASRKKCKLLGCNSSADKCHSPVNVMKMFQASVFCLQPSGDSYTRRSTFDSILAGCIPVFFHPGSAYVQYLWHLPKNYTKYSVFIPENNVKDKKVSIERILRRIPREQVLAMREEVIRLIPRMIYADPRSKLETLEDAFDIAVDGVLERVGKLRREAREGRNSSLNITEDKSWKYNLCGSVGEHEWDPFFSKTKFANS